MGVGTGLYVHDVVVKKLRSLSHFLMSSLYVIADMFMLLSSTDVASVIAPWLEVATRSGDRWPPRAQSAFIR